MSTPNANAIDNQEKSLTISGMPPKKRAGRKSVISEDDFILFVQLNEKLHGSKNYAGLSHLNVSRQALSSRWRSVNLRGTPILRPEIEQPIENLKALCEFMVRIYGCVQQTDLQILTGMSAGEIHDFIVQNNFV